MNISGKTVIIVNGKASRVGGRRFNEALRKVRATGDASCLDVRVPDKEEKILLPSKGGWEKVSEAVRQGKKATVRLS